MENNGLIRRRTAQNPEETNKKLEKNVKPLINMLYVGYMLKWSSSYLGFV